MSSTLCMRPTPLPESTEWTFKLPLKAIVARRYYDHDGSLGGGLITIDPQDVGWWEGVEVAGSFGGDDARKLRAIINTLKSGRSVDMWFEV